MAAKQTIISFVAALAIAMSATAQCPDFRRELSLDSIAGMRPRIKGESAQGMAIHDGILFALYHGGSCAVIDTATERLLGEFVIDGAEGTHCNNASFGPADEGFPLLYVSECNAPSRCFVEEVTPQGARLAATIIYEGSGIDSFCDWCVDAERNHLYAYGKTFEGGAVLKRFRLPSPDEADSSGVIRLHDDDVLWEHSYPAGYLRIPQGSHIHRGSIYLPTGHPAAGSCFIHVISLDDGERTALLDIDAIALEPEGVCMHDGRLWVMFGGGNGTLFSFALPSSEPKVAE